MKIESTLKYSLLLEIYGKLLTTKQRTVMRNFLDKDISISELAKLSGTTRQAVRDLIKRTMKILENFESKLKLLEKFTFIESKISNALQSLESGDMGKVKNNIKLVLGAL